MSAAVALQSDAGLPSGNIEKIQSALGFVQPHDRDEWVKVGMAVKSETGDAGFWVWDTWSQAAENYNEKAAKAVWKSFRSGKVQIGTLYHLAKERGWKWDQPERRLSAAEVEAMRAESRRRAEAAAAEKAAEQAKAAERAEAIWKEGNPVVGHEYLTRKGVKAHGLRLGRWEVIDNETDEVRLITPLALLVPIRDRKGKLWSLQALFPRKMMGGRDKDYLAGGAKAGHFHAIGKPIEHKGKRVFILCEGYSTGASIHECTGHLVLVCFDTSNLLSVAASIRERQPDAIILMAADNDQFNKRRDGTPYNPGVESASRAAAEVSGLLAVPQFASLDGQPTDWNDLHQREGSVPVIEQIVDVLNHGAIVTSQGLTEPQPAAVADAVTGQTQGAIQHTGERDEARRQLQKEENERLQELHAGAMFPSRMSVEEMLERLYWVAEGEMVAHVSDNRTMFLKFSEFRSLTAESVSFVASDDGAKKKPVPNSVIWKGDARRRNVMAPTFRAGADIVCADPDGKKAVNIWRPTRRWESKADIAPFLEHLAYLVEDEAEREVFLDWLAHLEQKPGELPHYGWLHIASHTGCGRNWLASVLARVWRGYVAPNVDLHSLLDSPYNGVLSGRVLAMVDEIQAGDGASYRHKNRLREMLNQEVRNMNPKFGRQYSEHNACRWLVFSNHLNALPIDNTDRRWRVVVHTQPPRAQEEYAKLYSFLADHEFINAVAVFLRNRDISTFKPGERPPMNKSKLAVVTATKTPMQQLAEEIAKYWPADVITNADVADVLSEGEGNLISPAMRRCMGDVGALNYGHQVKINGHPQRAWIIRGHDRLNQESERSEISKEAVKARALCLGDPDARSVLAEAIERARDAIERPNASADRPVAHMQALSGHEDFPI